MLCLVNVTAERYNTRQTSRVDLAGPRARSVHDTVLGVTQEIGRSTETVQHARTHHTGAVGVGVDVNLDRGVHTDAAQPADDLGGVRDQLGTEQKLRSIQVPVVVKALEPFRREPDRSGRGKVEVTAVEEIQESILQDLGPHLEILELITSLAQTSHDSVGDVSDTRLDGQEVLRQAAVVDFVFQELNEVVGDGLGGLILRRVRWRPVGVIGFDNGDNLLWIHGDVLLSDTILGVHNHEGLAARRKV